MTEITLDGGPWTDYDETQRLEDVERSTINVEIPDLATRSLVIRNLRYKKSLIGRGLVADLPGLMLRAGDRLEPTVEMRDVAKFDTTPPPFTASFLAYARGRSVLA